MIKEYRLILMINKKANLVFMAILYCFKDEFEREKNKDLFIQEIVT